MSKIFKNIPDFFVSQIQEEKHEDFYCVYRGIRHTHELTKEDFYPSAFDPYRQKTITLDKGPLYNFIARQPISDVQHYSVSLFLSLTALRKSLRSRNTFPSVAKGVTKKEKGVSVLDHGEHISYYLYDYENEDMSPYTDFKLFEEDL